MEYPRSLPVAQRKLPGNGGSCHISVFKWRRNGEWTFFPAGKQRSLPGQALRSGGTDLASPTPSAPGTSRFRGRGLEQRQPPWTITIAIRGDEYLCKSKGSINRCITIWPSLNWTLLIQTIPSAGFIGAIGLTLASVFCVVGAFFPGEFYGW